MQAMHEYTQIIGNDALKNKSLALIIVTLRKPNTVYAVFFIMQYQTLHVEHDTNNGNVMGSTPRENILAKCTCVQMHKLWYM